MSITSRIERNKSLKPFSTFGIGGEARYFVTVKTIEEMVELRRFLIEEQLPYLVIGKGSNSLFDDRGFDGMVILNKIHFIELKAGALYVGAGTSFSLLGAQMARKGWGGLEFASGIPGSVGGALYMNAGAGGSESADPLTSVIFVDSLGTLVERKKEALTFSYRNSSFHTLDAIIVAARFLLYRDPKARARQLALLAHRLKSQPYSEKSVGCIFRNPEEGAHAGALIESCGLKGRRIGDAEVSTLHANFIINRNAARSCDILALAELVKREVFEKSGYHLEMELRPLPYKGRASE